jgi:6-phosphogluconolactonase
MPLRWHEHRFADPVATAQALATQVAAWLRTAVDARERASLAVSGGTTPRGFLQQLGGQSLAWENVSVTLVDERWVPAASERSNARLVGETLLRGAAAAATFVPLYAEAAAPEDALARIEARVGELPLPLDVVVLGMGSDGHTASLFPGADRLAEALDPTAGARLLPLRAMTAGEPRVSMTLPVLAAARHACLLFQGCAKKQVFDAIVAGEGAWARSPLRAVVERMQAPLEVYWCE